MSTSADDTTIQRIHQFYNDEKKRRLSAESDKRKRGLIFKPGNRIQYYFGEEHPWGVAYGGIYDTRTHLFLPSPSFVTVVHNGVEIAHVVLMSFKRRGRVVSALVRFPEDVKYIQVPYKEIKAFEREMAPDEYEAEKPPYIDKTSSMKPEDADVGDIEDEDDVDLEDDPDRRRPRKRPRTDADDEHSEAGLRRTIGGYEIKMRNLEQEIIHDEDQVTKISQRIAVNTTEVGVLNTLVGTLKEKLALTGGI